LMQRHRSPIPRCGCGLRPTTPQPRLCALVPAIRASVTTNAEIRHIDYCGHAQIHLAPGRVGVHRGRRIRRGAGMRAWRAASTAPAKVRRRTGPTIDARLAIDRLKFSSETKPTHDDCQGNRWDEFAWSGWFNTSTDPTTQRRPPPILRPVPAPAPPLPRVSLGLAHGNDDRRATAISRYQAKKT
jgi:hypothetical protein